MFKRLALAVLLTPLLGAALSGCRTEGCLSGEAGCTVVSPCDDLQTECGNPGKLSVGTLVAAPAGAGSEALAAKGDVELSNGRVRAVISAIGNQNYLDPNGGSLIDFAPAGGSDGLNSFFTATGILPGDAVRYTSMRIIDESAESPPRVAVQVEGALDGHPDVKVYTLYELQPCEDGIRVRTEVINGSADTHIWTLSDGFYWGKRAVMPFTGGDNGFSHPSFGLSTIGAAVRQHAFVGASSHDGSPVDYAYVTCNADTVTGFQSEFVGAAGLAKTIVPPRDYLVLERFFAVTAGRDIAQAAAVAISVREQLHDEEYVTLKGKVERAGLPLLGERQASVIVREGDRNTPVEDQIFWSQAVPSATGDFSVRVPKGKAYFLEVHSFGVKGAEKEVAEVGGDTDLGTFTLPASSKMKVTVRETGTAAPLEAELFLFAADDATKAAAKGTFHGQFGECTPWLGNPHGPSPACNRVLVRGGTAEAEVPLGRYHVYAFKGPFWTIARQTQTFTPADTNLTFDLSPLPLKPAGTLSADFHIHGAASFDSSLPTADRVLSFASSDLDVAVATDHDVVTDYGPEIQSSGFGQKITSIVGIETTSVVLWMKIPESTNPKVIGHYNFWPVQYDPNAPHRGGPFDEYKEPGALFADMAGRYTSDTPIIELNHPWADLEFARDLGFPRALQLDTRKDLPDSDDGTRAGMYVRSAEGLGNASHHAQEVMNGTSNNQYLQYRAFWFYMLSQGRLVTGTANSDSHGLTENTVGMPRNIVYSATTAGPTFDVKVMNQAVRKGRVLGTNGPVIEAEIVDSAGTHPYSLDVLQPASGASLKIKVTAAPWVPVEEIRIVVNGKVVKTITGAEIAKPADPFGTTGLLRYDGSVPLAEVAPAGKDAWMIVEAGRPLLLAGDLGGGLENEPDGIPDTTDNNVPVPDGVVNEADIGTDSEGEKLDHGPLNDPPLPATEADPQFHYSRVLNGGAPAAFTNPFILSLDGNAQFNAPKVEGSK